MNLVVLLRSGWDWENCVPTSDKNYLICLPNLSSYDGDFTEEALVAFEEKFFKGELTPSLKSEEPSEEDMAEPVKVVKGKSFSKMVLENGKPCVR